MALYPLLLVLFIGAEAFSVYSDSDNSQIWRRHPRVRPMRSTTSEFSFTFDKQGLLGKVNFDIEVVLPPELQTRNITDIDVRFDPSSDMDGNVYITRGGFGHDFATLHFQSEADVGHMRAYVLLKSND